MVWFIHYVNSFTKLSNSACFLRIQRLTAFQKHSGPVRHRDPLPGLGIERHADGGAFCESNTGRRVDDFVPQRHARPSDPTERQLHFEMIVGEHWRAVIAFRVNNHRAGARRSGGASEMTPPRQPALLEVGEVRGMIRMPHRIAIAEPHYQLMPEWKAVVGHGR